MPPDSTRPGPPPVIRQCARALLSIAPSLPTLDRIHPILEHREQIEARGYFLPDEDDQAREMFAGYLRTRSALLANLRELRPYVRGAIGEDLFLQAFAVAFCNACLLVRTGRFLIDAFADAPVIWQKLDEADARYGIPRKQFTRIYKALTSVGNVLTFQRGVQYAVKYHVELEALADDPYLGPVITLMRKERPFIESSSDYYVTRMFRYRVHSFLRRNRSGFEHVTFALFKVSGRFLSELRNQWRRKRVTPRVRAKISRMLRPGDVIVTRHDDAATNLFLPGFWPHAALYIGSEDDRRTLGVQLDDGRAGRSGGPVCVLEARKDGVLFRAIEDTLAVDAFTVIRPRLTADELRDALQRACSHEGKLYDFEFDFRRSDRLVCTEVIYRSYHGVGPIAFELTEHAGRMGLSAEDLLDRAVDEEGFDVVAVYGVRGNRFATGPRALDLLVRSYRGDRGPAGSPIPAR